MPATVLITLDTRAPQITWGAAGQVAAGELLRVGYTLDEPAITAARLELVDGRVLPVDVLADHVEVLLPYDAPDGWAQLIVELEDDVGNAAEATLQVRIGGAIVEPPAPPPGPGPRRVRAERRTVLAPLVLRLRTGATRLRRRQRARRVAVRLGAELRRDMPPSLRRRQSSTLTVRAGRTRLVASRSAPVTLVVRTATAVTHRDGRQVEEALLLDLL